MGIRIVTDSTADLPRELIEELGITVVPLNVHFGDEVYKDQVEISTDEFFHKLQHGDVMPKTSQPSPGDFLEVYKELSAEGDSIISIHISSELSGTHNSAMLAKGMLPEADINVFDTRKVSGGIGLFVIEAARAVKAGKSKEEIIAMLENMQEKVRVIFILDSLEYLEKGGRIGKASAVLGSMLSLKPILTIEEGIVHSKEKARGFKKAKKRMVEMFAETNIATGSDVIILYGESETEAVAEIRDALVVTGKTQDILVSRVGAVIGTYSGPGILGLVYREEV